MTTDFNLTTEPWIPVTWRGTVRSEPCIGLRDAFSRSHEIFDLGGRPHERVALLRLLQCVAQAALGGPADYRTWRALAGSDYQPLRDAAVQYVDRHKVAFSLFHAERPFLQLAGLTPVPKRAKRKAKKDVSDDEDGDETAEKRSELLNLCFARDNTSTLFDQGGGTGRQLTPAQLALALLCYLNFAPGQPEGLALLNGKDEARSKGGKPAKDNKCYASDAPCLTAKAIHTFALGQCLAETIHLNMVILKRGSRFGFTEHQLGSPVWELSAQHLQRQNAATDGLTDAALRPALLECLVPMSRFARLNENCREVVLTNGVGYTPFLLGPDSKPVRIGMRLPSTALEQVKVKDQPKDVFVAAESGKALWRQLHLVGLLSKSERLRVPAWLTNVDELTAQDRESSAWRVRLFAVAALTNQAKFEAFVESVFEFRAGLLWRDATFNDYQAGVQYADGLEGKSGKVVAN